MADRSAAGGVMVALVGAVALVAGVRGVYGNIWRDLTAGTGPQVSNPQTSTAGGGGVGTILSAGGAAAKNLGAGADPTSLYAAQTPNGKYVAGASLYDHLSSTAYGLWSLAAGAVNEGATLLTSYNAARDVARWSYAQNGNESSWDHFDRLRHDLVKNEGMSIQAASDEVLREMYAAVTAAGGNWSLTGFGPVPLAGMLHV